MSPSGTGRLVEGEIVEEGMMYELEREFGERRFALAGPIDRARGTVEQTLMARRLPDGRWQPDKQTRQVRLADFEREVRTALEPRGLPHLCGDGPETGELGGARRGLGPIYGRFFIDYRQRYVGPCFLCGIPLVGSGPVGVYYRNTRESGYMCDTCFESEAPRLGLLLRVLLELKSAVSFSSNLEASRRSLVKGIEGIAELTDWDPRLSGGQGSKMRFRGDRRRRR